MKTLRFFLQLSIAMTTLLLMSCEDGLFHDCRKSNGSKTSLEFDMAEFNSFDFALSGNVIVTKGETQQVTISGPEDVVLNINTHVSNGHWKIKTRECFRKYDPVTITIQLPQLNDVTLSGAGNISVMDSYNTITSRLVLAGSGNILWKSISEQVETSIVGSGDITMIGEVDKLFETISGSGNILGKDFLANRVEITIAGSGNTEVSVDELLKVRIAGSGSVFYYGDPDSIDQNISGSGIVVKRD